MYDPEDSAKAIIAAAECGKAFAECGTTGIKATEKFVGFFAKVFGVPVEDAVGIVGDQLKYLRWERQNRLVDKVYEYLRKKGITTVRPIPPKFAIPFIENASLEEDDDLQDIWCRLIANALDSDFKLEIRFAYIDIIKNLTSIDAKVLELAYDQVLRKAEKADCIRKDYKYTCMKNIVVDLEIINKQLGVSEEELTISYNNLERVQCFRYAGPQSSVIVGNNETPPLMANGPIYVVLTPLGIAFIETCMK